MLQDFSSTTLPDVVATERLTLRRPTLADVRTIALLANDRRVAENTRRLPHPYSHDDAIEFIRATSELGSETVFLIEHDSGPVGMVGIDRSTPDNAELGYWLGVEHWGRGFATEAARGAIDFFFEAFEDDHLYAGARVTNPTSRNVLEKCGFQWSGVQLHRFLALGSSTPVDCFRLSRGVWASLKSWSSARRVR